MCFMSSDCYHRTRVFHALSRNQHILVRKGAKATEIHNDTPEKWMLVLTEVQSRILVSVQTRRTSYLSCMLTAFRVVLETQLERLLSTYYTKLPAKLSGYPVD